MVSAPFATNNTVTNGTKLPKNGLLSKSYHLPLGAAPPYLCLWRRNFCVAGGHSSFVTAVRFLNGQEALSIDYSGAKYVRLSRKSPLLKEHFFEWLKTAISSNACGTSTLKRPPSRGADAPHVHLRLRKRLSRCTLDCGFKTSESPALRGFVAERARLRAPLFILC